MDGRRNGRPISFVCLLRSRVLEIQFCFLWLPCLCEAGLLCLLWPQAPPNPSPAKAIQPQGPREEKMQLRLKYYLKVAPSRLVQSWEREQEIIEIYQHCWGLFLDYFISSPHLGLTILSIKGTAGSLFGK